MVSRVKMLFVIDTNQPHAPYAANIHGLANKWSYLCRTTPSISHHLKVLENTIKTVFIPNLTGRPPPSDIERKLLALPARLGGLGIHNLSLNLDDVFNSSLLVTAPLRRLIPSQDSVYTYQAHVDQMVARALVYIVKIVTK